jgi:hypothetical protein
LITGRGGEKREWGSILQPVLDGVVPCWRVGLLFELSVAAVVSWSQSGEPLWNKKTWNRKHVVSSSWEGEQARQKGYVKC